MTATIAPPAVTVIQPAVLEGISWQTYEMLLRDLEQNGHNVRLTYDEGRVAIMSPSPDHETDKKLIARMVEMLVLELDIPIRSLGSTTWRRAQLAKGLESDECYYIQREPEIRGQRTFDLASDPPPDLVIEIDVTNHPIDRIGIYRALRVPEVWLCSAAHVACLVLLGAEYREMEYSAAFPFLRVGELDRFLAMLPATDENSIIRAFRDWARAAFEKKQ